MQEATFLILTALAAGSQHGYGIMTDVAQISGGRVRLRAGTLYAALDRLRHGQLIEVDREETVDSRLRRYYQLTPFSNGADYYLRSPWEMFAMSCYALEAAALAASPGPRRGLRLLLTWRRGLALAVAAAATGILWKLTYGVYLSSGPAAQRAAALIVLGSIAIAMVMSSRLGRHLVVLFAIMFYPVALALARETAYVPLPVAMTRSWLALMYLPPLAARGHGRRWLAPLSRAHPAGRPPGRTGLTSLARAALARASGRPPA
jgi:Transcriptional regulator PadR-like family